MILPRKRRADCPEIGINYVKYLLLQFKKSVIIGHNRSSNPAGAPKTRVGGANRSGSLVGFRSCAAPQVKWRRVLRRQMMQKLVQNGARAGRRGGGVGSDADAKNSRGATESKSSRGGKMAHDVCRTGFGDEMRAGAAEICRAVSRGGNGFQFLNRFHARRAWRSDSPIRFAAPLTVNSPRLRTTGIYGVSGMKPPAGIE